MKINRIGENLTGLEKRQMETIDNLQERIRLLEFDKAKDNRKIKDYEAMIERRNNTLENIASELDTMRRENKYDRILIITNILKKISKNEV